jgi:hypothetical protein
MARYSSLHHKSTQKQIAKKRSHEQKQSFVEERQAASLTTYAESKKLKVPPAAASTSSAKTPDSDDDEVQVVEVKVKNPIKNQPSISAAMNRMHQSDIRKYNKATLDLAIADFFLSENLPDKAVDSKLFRRVLKLAKTVDSDYIPPNRNRIGGDLLDLQYNTCIEKNKELVLKEAEVFGVSWLSDGATVHRMPLWNVLLCCANISPITTAVGDATDHLKGGGKKDALYIANNMSDVVDEYDPQGNLTDVFFFDGASNVAKAGQVLEVIYPRTVALHGGEHVVSLYFSDLAKIDCIKVRCLLPFATLMT